MDDTQDKDLYTAEVMDRVERRLLKEKARAETEAQKVKIKKEIDTTVLQQNISDKKKTKRKKILISGIAGVVLIFVSLILISIFTPRRVSLEYDVCGTFLENTLRFPTELRISTVEDTDTFTRIWYTQVDAFGAYRMEYIQCFWKQDANQNWVFDKIVMNKRDVDPRVVEKFNRIIPMLLEHPPNLVWPEKMPDRLEDLKFDPDSLRKSIL